MYIIYLCAWRAKMEKMKKRGEKSLQTSIKTNQEMERWEHFFTLLLKLDKFVRFIEWSYEQSWKWKIGQQNHQND